MKKKLLLLGMAALLCALGLVLVGCDDGGGGGGNNGGGGDNTTKFEGTWKTSTHELTFSDSTFTAKTLPSTPYNSGTFTFTDARITFNVTGGAHSGSTCVAGYVLSGATLTLTHVSGSGFDGWGIAGTYTKE
jgi:hypothetical protein